MSDQAHPDPIEDPEGWAEYQADHETDEAERERLTAEAVKRDNHDAMEAL